MKKKVGIGFIGTGFARKVQIPCFLTCDEAWIASVASATLENAQSTADEFGVGHFSTDWRETVAHPEVDLVCITTPPNMHREMALFAIENDKHILCEKPMAMNISEAEEMVLAAAGKSRLALIDHELRFQPGRQKAFEMLRNGDIGKIRHAKAIFYAPQRGNPDLQWNWWSDATAGGGALGAINSHIIDSFNWLLGTRIDSVSCQLNSHIKERRDEHGDLRSVTTDDEANMLLRFADSDLTNDATGLVSVSMIEYPKYKNQLFIHGTKGAIRIDERGDLFVVRTGEKDWREVDVRMGEFITDGLDSGFARGFLEFAPKIITAIFNGETTIDHAATFEDGLEVQRVIDAARKSDRTGSVVLVA